MAKLITGRSKLDPCTHVHDTAASIIETNGVFGLDEDVICIYADLDTLIDECRLTTLQTAVLHWLMQGYATTEVGESLSRSRREINTHFKRLVARICLRNQERWQNLPQNKQVYSDCSTHMGEDDMGWLDTLVEHIMAQEAPKAKKTKAKKRPRSRFDKIQAVKRELPGCEFCALPGGRGECV